MLVVFTFPIADLRGFVSQNTYQLKKPPVPANPGDHFIRSTGEVTVRLQGGSMEVMGEDLYCEAKGACRLPTDYSWASFYLDSVKIQVKCVFRRFFRTGPATSRFDIGFRVNIGGFSNRQDLSLESIIENLGTIPVRIGPSKNHTDSIPLIKTGNALANHFRITSTVLKNKQPYIGKSWWCSAGDPLVLVELNNSDHLTLPKHLKTVDALAKSGTNLYFKRIVKTIQHQQLGCWILSFLPNVDITLARQLRMHLVRLHGEVQALKLVVQLSQTDLAITPQSSECAVLESYLLQMTRLLNKPKRYGTNQHNLLVVAYESHQAAKPGELKTILNAAENLMVKISDEKRISEKYQTTKWEKILAIATAIFIVLLVSFLVVRNNEFVDPNLVVMLRILISLSAAILGAVIPGFLNVSWRGSGLSIRAGGALALFVLTFMFTPTVL